ncbi:hypothetical protein [Devosia sp.]|uniref:hypothetical protein n=1 Tax=Devosia sp. TaxID=1871048 RepID=UPI001AFE796D|nr:hypothetical protein [Devosia sp.]MBO9589324.1 hypothetical protein [Devosia sp.]
MIARISLLALSLALIAVPTVAKDKVKAAPDAPRVVSCDGVFGPKSSDALVRETFGEDNVETGTVYGVEGIEFLATTVYPDDPERVMQFSWWDEEKLEYLSSVELAPSQETPAGVRIGMSVEEVEAINGEPFTIGGFWWDYGGGAVFEKGALANPETGCGFWIRFAPKDEYPESVDVTPVSGEVTVRSSEPLLETLDVRVQSINLGYPWPEELPQPEY